MTVTVFILNFSIYFKSDTDVMIKMVWELFKNMSVELVSRYTIGKETWLSPVRKCLFSLKQGICLHPAVPASYFPCTGVLVLCLFFFLLCFVLIKGKHLMLPFVLDLLCIFQLKNVVLTWFRHWSQVLNCQEQSLFEHWICVNKLRVLISLWITSTLCDSILHYVITLQFPVGHVAQM